LPELSSNIEDSVSAAVVTEACRDAPLDGEGSVDDVFHEFPDSPVLSAALPWDFLVSLLYSASGSQIFRSIRLGARLDLVGLLPGHPKVQWVRRWKADMAKEGVEDLPRRGKRNRDKPAEFVDTLLELPRLPTGSRASASSTAPSRKRRAIDPMLMINACFFTRHLRSSRHYKEAAADAWRLDHPDSEEEGERNADNDPSRTQLDRGMKRVDILDCLLLRRFFHALAEFDLLFSVSLWSDSSPASGEEIQGMVADVMCVDGTHERIVLPGSTLSYGMFDSISKAISLLHALCVYRRTRP